MKEFFWLCAGANATILQKCPSEASKYAGIGATIFFTGLFASFAGGYALYTVFDSYWIASGIGLLWGVTIFNIDRFIVSSLRKNGEPKQEWISAAPRLLLALIISIVIAKPLELKIFEKEINSEIALMIQEDLRIKEQEVRRRFTEQRATLMSEVNSLKSEIETKTNKRNELRSIAQQEADGTGGSQQRNAGPIYQIKKADAERVDQELQQLIVSYRPIIQTKEAELLAINQAEQGAIGELVKGQLTGLASRIDAFSRIATRSDAISLAHWFIVLLFIAIETAPIFVKLISQRGPYDFLLRKEEYEYEAAYYEDLAKVNSLIKKRTGKLTNDEVAYIKNRLSLSLEKT